MSKRTVLFLIAFVLSTACDFYWGYYSSHSFGDGIIQVLRGFLVLAILLGIYQLQKSD